MLFTKDLSICEGKLAEICAETWKEVTATGAVKTIVAVGQGYRAAIQDDNSMAKIFVKTLTGRTMTTQVDLTSTVLDLKALIQQQNDGWPIANQRLIFAGRCLENECSLGATIYPMGLHYISCRA